MNFRTEWIVMWTDEEGVERTRQFKYLLEAREFADQVKADFIPIMVSVR